MSSNKGKARARQLARAKHERQLARRATAARHRRQWKAVAGIVAILVAGVGVAWFFGAFSSSDSSDKPASNDSSASQEDTGTESSPPESDDEPSQDDKDE